MEAQRQCFGLLDTLYLRPNYSMLRFQSLVDSRIYATESNDIVHIEDSILSAVLSNLHDVIVPAESGDKVVQKIRCFSKEAEQLAVQYDLLDSSVQNKILGLMAVQGPDAYKVNSLDTKRT